MCLERPAPEATKKQAIGQPADEPPFHQKNQKFLIEVFSKYLKLNPKAYLLIIGQGELEKELLTQAEQLGIKDRVILPAFKSNVSDYYNAMYIFFLPII